MLLRAAAGFFDDVPCYDAYSGEFVFKGQLVLYDETKRDSEAGERRVLSVKPDVVQNLPARRAVKAGGVTLLLGHPNFDFFRGRAVRAGIVAHEATTLGHVYTLEQYLLGQSPVDAYCGRAWVKNLAYSEQNSKLVPQHHVFFSKAETVQQGQLLVLGDTLSVVRMSYEGPAGMLIVLADQLPIGALRTASVEGETYDPVNESWSGSSASVQVLCVRWQSLFAYRSTLAPAFGPEDLQIAVAKASLTAKPGMKLQMGAEVWQLASVADEGGVWLCRATRHA
jgi:hypothetical protein